MSKSYGIIGDLADCFPVELKQLFLAEWLASELRYRAKLPPDVKKNLRWARDVSLNHSSLLLDWYAYFLI
jgi:importin subunit beta-1